MKLLDYVGYRISPKAQDETKCHLVSSRGLLKSCKFHDAHPKSSSDRMISASDFDLSSGDSIYVTTDALSRFKAELLPQIVTPFVLLTGDSDRGVNPTELELGTIEVILNNPYLIRWFAQNLTAEHTKQTNMPIGLDYHTKTRKLRHGWGGFQTPAIQELELVSVALNAPKIEEKAILGYCNWHFAANRGTRQNCMSRIERSAMYFEPKPVLRKESWEKNSEFLFTISPTGFGTDCHRTWEAIALGTIPIVDKSELSPLFANLPVIEVTDWSVVTAEFLGEQAEKYLNRRFEFGPMFLGYWEMRLRGEKPDSLSLSFSDFVKFGVERGKEIYS